MKRKMSLEDELDVTRTSVAELTGWCITIALHDLFGIGRERLNRVNNRQRMLAEQSMAIMMQPNERGMPSTEKARRMRAEALPESVPREFRVPALRAARNRREQQLKIVGDRAATMAWQLHARACMLDLQLFAQASDQLQNTTATLTAEMKTYYEKRLLDQAEPALVHNQFGDPYPIPANGGKTIELRRYDSLPKATTPLTEGVTPNGQTLKVSTVTAELHQYGGWVPITDVLKTTALDNNVLQATKILASQAGRTLDSVTRDVLVGGTNVLYASKTVDGVETAVNSRKNLDKTAKITLEICLRALTGISQRMWMQLTWELPGRNGFG